MLRRIQDDASLQDIAQELEFIAAVRPGLSELDNGDSVSIEEFDTHCRAFTAVTNSKPESSHHFRIILLAHNVCTAMAT